MEIKVSQEERRVPVTVFHLEGRINLGNAEELQEKALEAHENGTRSLVLDLAEVPSLTSAGLRAILYIYKLFNTSSEQMTGGTGKSHQMKLANPTPYVLQVLTVAGFNRSIEIYDSLQEALDSF